MNKILFFNTNYSSFQNWSIFVRFDLNWLKTQCWIFMLRQVHKIFFMLKKLFIWREYLNTLPNEWMNWLQQILQTLQKTLLEIRWKKIFKIHPIIKINLTFIIEVKQIYWKKIQKTQLTLYLNKIFNGSNRNQLFFFNWVKCKYI